MRLSVGALLLPFLHIPQDVQEKEKPKFAKRAPHSAH